MTKNKKVILVLVIVACGLFNLVEVFNPAKETPSVTAPVGPTPLQHKSITSVVECQQHVRTELLSPSSAKFSNVKDYTINGKPANYHAVIGTIEAQNAFGVVLESQFRCDLHYLPDKPEVWVLDEFRLE